VNSIDGEWISIEGRDAVGEDVDGSEEVPALSLDPISSTIPVSADTAISHELIPTPGLPAATSSPTNVANNSQSSEGSKVSEEVTPEVAIDEDIETTVKPSAAEGAKSGDDSAACKLRLPVT
jgi:hypothetical protein